MPRYREFDFPEEAREFPLVDKGKYRCVVYDVAEEPSREGNPMLSFQYKIIDEGEFKGLMLFDRYSLLPQSMWKLQQTLLTFGVNALGKKSVDLDVLLGVECEVTVIHQNYEGEPQPRVRKVVGLESLKGAIKKEPTKVKPKKEPKPTVKKKTEDKGVEDW